MSGSKLNYCEVSYGGYSGGDGDANIYVNGTTAALTVSNCQINQSQGWGMILDNATLTAQSTGNTYSGNLLGTVHP
ncbi:MAG: hypothetical protein HY958_10635 [Bacteroidia bacterium]|nr:hypothetical protein [Bacteroidia bacterium]